MGDKYERLRSVCAAVLFYGFTPVQTPITYSLIVLMILMTNEYIDRMIVVERFAWQIIFANSTSNTKPDRYCQIYVLGLIATLCIIQPYNYCTIAPLLAVYAISEVADRKCVAASSSFLWRTLALYAVVGLGIAVLLILQYLIYHDHYVFVAFQARIAPIFASSNAGNATTAMEPRYGVLWYLQLQMLPEYETYFSVLVLFVQLVSSVLATALLAPFDPYAAIHILFLLCQFFHSKPDAIGMIIVIYRLLNHDKATTTAMRHLPWLILGLLVPVFLSPIMQHVWLDLGTGNANFLFFQGLCMWISLTAIILEYITANFRCHDAIGDKVD